MAKVNVSFEQFSKAASSFGKPVKQTDKIFYVKADKAGKIELNCNSGTWTVGSGSKYLAEITSAVKAAGFAVTKENRGWTILNFVSLGQFGDLASAVTGSIPAAVEKVAKTKKDATAKTMKALAGSGLVKSTKAKTIAEVKALRAKNLEMIKRTSQSYSQKLIEKMGDGADVSNPSDSDAPTFLTKDKLRREYGVA